MKVQTYARAVMKRVVLHICTRKVRKCRWLAAQWGVVGNLGRLRCLWWSAKAIYIQAPRVSGTYVFETVFAVRVLYGHNALENERRRPTNSGTTFDGELSLAVGGVLGVIHQVIWSYESELLCV